MQTFQIDTLLAESKNQTAAWMEFLRVPSMSMGLYSLKAGQADLQKPHSEDEVYYVLAGKASFQFGQQRQEAKPGTLLFVERGIEHRFFDVSEDLTVLVFFAPAEGSERKD